MSQKLNKMVIKDEDEEEVLLLLNVIVVEIYHVRRDEHAWNHTIIASYT